MALDWGIGSFDGGAMDASLPSVFDTALTMGSLPTYDQPRTADTATANAIQSSAPIVADSGGWGDFWKPIANTLVSYAVAKDLQQTRVQTQVVAGNVVASRARTDDRRLLLLVGVGLAVYMVTRH
jgi:hypothetical protein